MERGFFIGILAKQCKVLHMVRLNDPAHWHPVCVTTCGLLFCEMNSVQVIMLYDMLMLCMYSTVMLSRNVCRTRLALNAPRSSKKSATRPMCSFFFYHFFLWLAFQSYQFLGRRCYSIGGSFPSVVCSVVYCGQTVQDRPTVCLEIG